MNHVIYEKAHKLKCLISIAYEAAALDGDDGDIANGVIYILDDMRTLVAELHGEARAEVERDLARVRDEGEA